MEEVLFRTEEFKSVNVKGMREMEKCLQRTPAAVTVPGRPSLSTQKLSVRRSRMWTRNLRVSPSKYVLITEREVVTLWGRMPAGPTLTM